MKKVRLNLLVAFVVLGGVAIYCALNISSSTSWLSFLSLLVGACVFGVWALADLLVLGNSFLVAQEADLWETRYFKFMRDLHGERFGGPKYVYDKDIGEEILRPLAISTCRAVGLSIKTVILGIVVLVACVALATVVFGGPGYISYTAWSVVTVGIDSPANAFWDADSTRVSNAIMFLTLGGSLIQILLFVVAMIFVFAIQEVVYRNIARAIFSLWFFINSFLIFGVFPAQMFGLAQTFKWAGIVGGVIVGILLAVCLILVFIVGASKLSKQLSQNTIGGILGSEWLKAKKERFCPMIVQGESFVGEQVEETS